MAPSCCLSQSICPHACTTEPESGKAQRCSSASCPASISPSNTNVFCNHVTTCEHSANHPCMCGKASQCFFGLVHAAPTPAHNALSKQVFPHESFAFSFFRDQEFSALRHVGLRPLTSCSQLPGLLVPDNISDAMIVRLLQTS